MSQNNKNLGSLPKQQTININYSGLIQVAGQDINKDQLQGNGDKILKWDDTNDQIVGTDFDEALLSNVQSSEVGKFLSNGYILYGNGTRAIQNDSNLFWDLANNRLGINNDTPSYNIDVDGDINFTGSLYSNGTLAQFGTSLPTGQIAYGNGTGLVGETDLTWDSNNGRLIVGGTDSIVVPIGTTAERPSVPQTGMLRFNSDTVSFEAYNGIVWGGLGGGSGSGASISLAQNVMSVSLSLLEQHQQSATASNLYKNDITEFYEYTYDGFSTNSIETGGNIGGFTMGSNFNVITLNDNTLITQNINYGSESQRYYISDKNDLYYPHLSAIWTQIEPKVLEISSFQQIEYNDAVNYTFNTGNTTYTALNGLSGNINYSQIYYNGTVPTNIIPTISMVWFTIQRDDISSSSKVLQTDTRVANLGTDLNIYNGGSTYTVGYYGSNFMLCHFLLSRQYTTGNATFIPETEIQTFVSNWVNALPVGTITSNLITYTDTTGTLDINRNELEVYHQSAGVQNYYNQLVGSYDYDYFYTSTMTGIVQGGTIDSGTSYYYPGSTENNVINIFYNSTLKSSVEYGTQTDDYWVSPKGAHPHTVMLRAGDTANDMYIEYTNQLSGHTLSSYRTLSADSSYDIKAYEGQIYTQQIYWDENTSNIGSKTYVWFTVIQKTNTDASASLVTDNRLTSGQTFDVANSGLSSYSQSVSINCRNCLLFGMLLSKGVNNDNSTPQTPFTIQEITSYVQNFVSGLPDDVYGATGNVFNFNLLRFQDYWKGTTAQGFYDNITLNWKYSQVTDSNFNSIYNGGIYPGSSKYWVTNIDDNTNNSINKISLTFDSDPQIQDIKYGTITSNYLVSPFGTNYPHMTAVWFDDTEKTLDLQVYQSDNWAGASEFNYINSEQYSTTQFNGQIFSQQNTTNFSGASNRRPTFSLLWYSICETSNQNSYLNFESNTILSPNGETYSSIVVSGTNYTQTVSVRGRNSVLVYGLFSRQDPTLDLQEPIPISEFKQYVENFVENIPANVYDGSVVVPSADLSQVNVDQISEYLLGSNARTLYDTFDTNAFQYVDNITTSNYILYGGDKLYFSDTNGTFRNFMFGNNGFYIDFNIDGTFYGNIGYGTKNDNFYITPPGSMPMMAIAWASNTEIPILIGNSNQTKSYQYVANNYSSVYSTTNGISGQYNVHSYTERDTNLQTEASSIILVFGSMVFDNDPLSYAQLTATTGTLSDGTTITDPNPNITYTWNCQQSLVFTMLLSTYIQDDSTQPYIVDSNVMFNYIENLMEELTSNITTFPAYTPLKVNTNLLREYSITSNQYIGSNYHVFNTNTEFYTGSNFRIGQYYSSDWVADFYHFGYDDNRGNQQLTFANFGNYGDYFYVRDVNRDNNHPYVALWTDDTEQDLRLISTYSNFDSNRWTSVSESQNYETTNYYGTLYQSQYAIQDCNGVGGQNAPGFAHMTLTVCQKNNPNSYAIPQTTVLFGTTHDQRYFDYFSLSSSTVGTNDTVFRSRNAMVIHSLLGFRGTTTPLNVLYNYPTTQIEDFINGLDAYGVFNTTPTIIDQTVDPVALYRFMNSNDFTSDYQTYYTPSSPCNRYDYTLSNATTLNVNATINGELFGGTLQGDVQYFNSITGINNTGTALYGYTQYNFSKYEVPLPQFGFALDEEIRIKIGNNVVGASSQWPYAQYLNTSNYTTTDGNYYGIITLNSYRYTGATYDPASVGVIHYTIQQKNNPTSYAILDDVMGNETGGILGPNSNNDQIITVDPEFRVRNAIVGAFFVSEERSGDTPQIIVTTTSNFIQQIVDKISTNGDPIFVDKPLSPTYSHPKLNLGKMKAYLTSDFVQGLPITYYSNIDPVNIDWFRETANPTHQYGRINGFCCDPNTSQIDRFDYGPGSIVTSNGISTTDRFNFDTQHYYSNISGGSNSEYDFQVVVSPKAGNMVICATNTQQLNNKKNTDEHGFRHYFDQYSTNLQYARETYGVGTDCNILETTNYYVDQHSFWTSNASTGGDGILCTNAVVYPKNNTYHQRGGNAPQLGSKITPNGSLEYATTTFYQFYVAENCLAFNFITGHDNYVGNHQSVRDQVANMLTDFVENIPADIYTASLTELPTVNLKRLMAYQTSDQVQGFYQNIPNYFNIEYRHDNSIIDIHSGGGSLSGNTMGDKNSAFQLIQFRDYSSGSQNTILNIFNISDWRIGEYNQSEQLVDMPYYKNPHTATLIAGNTELYRYIYSYLDMETYSSTFSRYYLSQIGYDTTDYYGTITAFQVIEASTLNRPTCCWIWYTVSQKENYESYTQQKFADFPISNNEASTSQFQAYYYPVYDMKNSMMFSTLLMTAVDNGGSTTNVQSKIEDADIKSYVVNYVENLPANIFTPTTQTVMSNVVPGVLEQYTQSSQVLGYYNNDITFSWQWEYDGNALNSINRGGAFDNGGSQLFWQNASASNMNEYRLLIQDSTATATELDITDAQYGIYGSNYWVSQKGSYPHMSAVWTNDTEKVLRIYNTQDVGTYTSFQFENNLISAFYSTTNYIGHILGQQYIYNRNDVNPVPGRTLIWFTISDIDNENSYAHIRTSDRVITHLETMDNATPNTQNYTQSMQFLCRNSILMCALFSRVQQNIPLGTRRQDPIPEREIETFVTNYVENLPAGIFGTFTDQGAIAVNYTTIETYQQDTGVLGYYNNITNAYQYTYDSATANELGNGGALDTLNMFGGGTTNNIISIMDGIGLTSSINYGTSSGNYWVAPKTNYPHMASTYIGNAQNNVYIEISANANDHTNYSTSSYEISYATTNSYNGNIYVQQVFADQDTDVLPSITYIWFTVQQTNNSSSTCSVLNETRIDRDDTMTNANSSSDSYTQRINFQGRNTVIFYALLSAGDAGVGVQVPINKEDIKTFVENFVQNLPVGSITNV